MSAQVMQNQLKTADRGFMEVMEEIEMRLAKGMTKVKTRVTQGMTPLRPAKLIGGLALGALLLTAAAPQFGTAYADGPSRPQVTEETVVDRGDDILPGDAWMYHSPFYEDFGAVNRVEAQGPAGDAWIYDSPFYEAFQEAGRVAGSNP